MGQMYNCKKNENKSFRNHRFPTRAARKKSYFLLGRNCINTSLTKTSSKKASTIRPSVLLVYMASFMRAITSYFPILQPRSHPLEKLNVPPVTPPLQTAPFPPKPEKRAPTPPPTPKRTRKPLPPRSPTPELQWGDPPSPTRQRAKRPPYDRILLLRDIKRLNRTVNGRKSKLTREAAKMVQTITERAFDLLQDKMEEKMMDKLHLIRNGHYAYEIDQHFLLTAANEAVMESYPSQSPLNRMDAAYFGYDAVKAAAKHPEIIRDMIMATNENPMHT